jgi:sodium-dependent dicarboxylate transporter 2/3/5
VVGGPLAALAVYVAAAGLPAAERRLAAILTLVIVFWVSEAIPLPATAMLGPALCALLGVADPASVFRPFADRVIFLFLGSFLLARAMAVNGLDRRVALAVMSARAVGGSPARLRLAVGTVFLLSMDQQHGQRGDGVSHRHRHERDAGAAVRRRGRGLERAGAATSPA